MKSKLLKIIKHYGIDNQLRKFNEENFELIEAIIKMIYPKFTGYMYIDELKQNIKEEIADNLVLLSQFILYYDINLDEIEEIFKYKVDRQIKRMEKENE